MAHAEAEIQESIYLNIPAKRDVSNVDVQKNRTIVKEIILRTPWVNICLFGVAFIAAVIAISLSASVLITFSAIVKGDNGQSDSTREKIDRLTTKNNEQQTHIQELKNQLETNNRTLNELKTSFCNIAGADPGWYDPGNGYQYRKSETEQNWQNSRLVCRGLGGDLASTGIRDLNIRSKVINAVLKTDDAWIGLNDFQREGTYVFLDGVAGTAQNIRWAPLNPSGDGDCIHINLRGEPHNTANDIACRSDIHALCENRLIFSEIYLFC